MEKKIKIFNDIYLDQDTDPKINEGSDYILNTVLTSDGRYKICVNIKGNELATDPVLLNSQFGTIDNQPIKIVGSCKDDARSRIIYFVTTNVPSQGSYYSGIMYLDINTGENKIILIGYYFGLTYTSVVNATVIGDLLYWTDGTNPKKINYIRAYNYQQGISTDYKYQTVNANVIDAYKKPPSIPISAGGSYSIYATKVIPNKIYQFAYRYAYSDNEKSVLSPFSNLVFSTNSQFPDGSSMSYSSAWAVQLIFKIFENISGVYNDVSFVELYVRNGDIGDWYLYDKIDAPKMVSFTLTYFSSGTYDQGSGISTSNVRGTVTQSVYDKLTVGQYVSRSSVNYYIVEKYTSGGNYIIGLDTTIAGTGWSYTFTVIDDFIYLFKDDKIKQAVDQADLSRPFDYLPKKANNQELVEKDKLIYGDITEGFDQADANIDTSIVSTNTALSSNFTAGITASSSQRIDVRFSSYSYPLFYSILFEYTKTTSSTTEDTYYLASYVSRSGDTETTILTRLKESLVAQAAAGSVSLTVTLETNISPSYKYIKIIYPLASGGFSLSVGASPKVWSLLSTYRTLKNKDVYLGAIRYYDKNLRFSSENKFNAEVVVPDFDNTARSNMMYSLSCQIKHKPPLEAYYYSLDFTKRTKTGYFIRMTTTITDAVFYFDKKDGYARLAINKIINDSIDTNKELKLNSYDFEEGDRITIFIYDGRTGPVTYATPIDVEIKSIEWPKTDSRYQKDYAATPAYILDSSGNKVANSSSQVIIIPATMQQLGMSFPTAGSITYEIYRPKKEVSAPYYFPNYFGTIGNPGTTNNYHVGSNPIEGGQNQNPNSPAITPAIVKCNPGDVYIKLRLANGFFTTIDDNYSDYYISNSYGLGMPNIFDPDAKEERLIAGMRYSGSLLHDTKVNRLNRFDTADRVILKSKFGNIHSIKEVGDVLKVLQDKKETSIYIGKEEITNSDGSTILRTTTNVLGNQNAYDELRGTVYPRSVVVHNRNMYYWDSVRKEVIRSSPNGQFPISSYGMSAYFKNKTGYTDVIAGFDEENSLYLLTFIGGTSETIGFFDPDIESDKPRWLSFFSFIPEHYERIGKYMISFNLGIGYKHNSSNVNRCTFYTVKYKQQINWFMNSAVQLLFKALAVKSNKPWSVPTIYIEPNSTYTRGMLSKLNTNHFITKEGNFYAPYLNNMLTVSNTPNNLYLINGDKLRGFTIKHSMENMQNVEVWIFETEVYFDPSNRYE